MSYFDDPSVAVCKWNIHFHRVERKILFIKGYRYYHYTRIETIMNIVE